MNKQTHEVRQKREYLERVRKVTKEHDTSRVNNLLRRGWRILAIEQQYDDPCGTTTYYILGHIEENAE